MKITKIYMGKDRVCRCGCAGEYVYPDNPKFVKRVKRFEKMWATYTPTEDDQYGSYRNVSYGKNRAITAYYD
jgi:hypothetical protein